MLEASDRLTEENVQTYDSLSKVILEHSDWNNLSTQPNWVNLETPFLAISHQFAEDSKIWLVENGDMILIRRDYKNERRLSILFDKQRKLMIGVPEFGDAWNSSGRRSYFSSLLICLSMIALAWLAVLAPFFYLRLAPNAQIKAVAA